ncbi:hypothetical protein EI94DRAFT_1794389 [Lactarius quietus]|nr:hypothetical protein EI94DRAFT_1794389 [Lactarius quietus]
MPSNTMRAYVISFASEIELTTQEYGRVKPTIILCETISQVPVWINQVNLQQLLINAFLSPWLKKFANYPLCPENVESVRLIKGPDKGFDGKKVPKMTELNIMLVLDVDHYNEAQTHRASHNASPTDPDLEHVNSFKRSSTSKHTLLVTHTEQSNDHNFGAAQSSAPSQIRTRPHVCPRPIYNMKRKLSESDSPSTSDQQASSSHVLRGQKHTRTCSDQTSHLSHVMTGNNLKQALIAQHEPPSTAINGLRVYSLIYVTPSNPLF